MNTRQITEQADALHVLLNRHISDLDYIDESGNALIARAISEATATAEAERDEAIRERDEAISPHMVAGLLMTLREECERQHARAETAEAQLAKACRASVAQLSTAQIGDTPATWEGVYHDAQLAEARRQVLLDAANDLDTAIMNELVSRHAVATWLRQRAQPPAQTEERMTTRTYQRRIAALRQLLDECEWVQPTYNGSPSCSHCGNQQHWGHRSDCGFVTLLGRDYTAQTEAPRP